MIRTRNSKTEKETYEIIARQIQPKDVLNVDQMLLLLLF
jgi:hypothetical protein